MSLIDINLRPSDRQLRQFGSGAAIALPLLGGIRGAGATWISGLLTAGLLLALMGWLRPRMLKIPFVTLTLCTFPIGVVVSEALLLVTFILVFVPIGLVLRCCGRDRLQLRRDPDRVSYWQPKSPPRDVASYFQQW